MPDICQYQSIANTEAGDLTLRSISSHLVSLTELDCRMISGYGLSCLAPLDRPSPIITFAHNDAELTAHAYSRFAICASGLSILISR